MMDRTNSSEVATFTQSDGLALPEPLDRLKLEQDALVTSAFSRPKRSPPEPEDTGVVECHEHKGEQLAQTVLPEQRVSKQDYCDVVQALRKSFAEQFESDVGSIPEVAEIIRDACDSTVTS